MLKKCKSFPWNINLNHSNLFEFPHHRPEVRMVEDVPIVVDGKRISVNAELKY